MMDFPKLPCPCCGHLTLLQKCAHEICPVCHWEDDPAQREDRLNAGGANKIALFQARDNFLARGACSEDCLEHVRPPLPNEIPD
jgi:hypothetical protein